jgi:putative PIN family toxin of toxin-antitoxin system
MRVLIDSNVLVSALVNPGASRRLLFHLLDEHTVVSSVEILAELEGVLSREKFSFTKSRVDEYLSLIASISTIVDVGEPPRVVEGDPDDDVVLATANYGRADYIVTGDRHLLRLGEYDKTKIVSVREMLTLLKE